LDRAREDLIQEVGRLSSFAGFNKAMGQIYALLYLSKEPVSLSDIAQQLGISKGNASLNIQTMERWGLVHPINKKGDRRDYYQAETDFWKIIRDIVNERDRKEIDRTISSIAAILNSVKGSGDEEDNPERRFYRERLERMLEFGNAINQIMQASLTLQNFRLNVLKHPVPGADHSQRIEVEG
jgi:HTH-type transcriptional regulator, glycine betaine synthesis regulator